MWPTCLTWLCPRSSGSTTPAGFPRLGTPCFPVEVRSLGGPCPLGGRACMSGFATIAVALTVAPIISLVQKQTHKIEVPRSVPGMVTDRLLVMNFLDGIPITRLKDHTKK